MASHIVLYIQSNPRESHCVCEGVRIALGLAACNLKVDLILSASASFLLTDDMDECVDGELVKQYLPSLMKFIATIYIAEEGSALPILQNEYPITFLSKDEIVQKIDSAESCINF
jgi:hypothetical protein